MIGGVVIEASESRIYPDIVFVDCFERSKTCGIYLEKTEQSLAIEIGDQIWWQGQYAFWTPRLPGNVSRGESSVCRDIRLRRIGYSGVKHPDLKIWGQ